MKMKALVAVLLISIVAAAELPNAPTPQTEGNYYGSGFNTDNQLYVLQGFGVSALVGGITNRPWIGGASGVGSCMLYRAIHDPMVPAIQHDTMFARNRILFCGVGSAGGYVMLKVLHVGKKKK